MSISTNKRCFNIIKRKVIRGFTLIEIMVSLLVLSVGLLGMMALQNVALRHNQSAYYESQAAFLANDILDRIRASKNSGAYALGLLANPPTQTQDCEVAICSTTQMAVWDLNQWRTAITVTSNLPQATGGVVFSGVNDVAITIRYDDSRDPLNPQPRDFVIRAQI